MNKSIDLSGSLGSKESGSIEFVNGAQQPQRRLSGGRGQEDNKESEWVSSLWWVMAAGPLAAHQFHSILSLIQEFHFMLLALLLRKAKTSPQLISSSFLSGPNPKRKGRVDEFKKRCLN